MKILIVIVF